MPYPAEIIISPERIPPPAYFDPLPIARDLWKNRQLIFSLAIRDVQARFAGSWFGAAWIVLKPLFLLAVYTFVFGVVFHARWAQAEEANSVFSYSVALFCGLVAFGIFAESVGTAPFLIQRQAGFVKKMVFPVQILPVAFLLSVVLSAMPSAVILMIGVFVLRGTIPLYALLFPLVVLPLALLALAFSWGLAAVGVFFRDLENGVGLAIALLYFSTPIFYPAEAVPPPYRTMLTFNPLSVIVGAARDVVVWGHPPNWGSLAAVMLISVMAAQVGYGLIIRVKHSFPDVL